jgi:hypothetical protein
MSERPHPAEALESLAHAEPAANAPPTSRSAIQLLGVGPSSNGTFVLYWNVVPAPPSNSWDWVGLFPTDGTPDLDPEYYQWSVDGTQGAGEKSQDTKIALHKEGYEARYYTYDYGLSAYQLLMTTPIYRGEVWG